MKTLQQFILEEKSDSVELLKRTSDIDTIIELFNQICKKYKKLKSNFYLNLNNKIEIGLIKDNNWNETCKLICSINGNENELTHGSYLVQILKKHDFIENNQKVQESIKTEDKLTGKNLEFKTILYEDEFDEFYNDYLSNCKAISLTKKFQEYGKYKYQIYFKGEDLTNCEIVAVYDIEENILRTSIEAKEYFIFKESFEHEKSLEDRQLLSKQLLNRKKIENIKDAQKFLKEFSINCFDDISKSDLLKIFNIDIIDKLIQIDNIRIHQVEKDLFMIIYNRKLNKL